MGDREKEVRDGAIARLVVSTARLWQVVFGAEVASASSRASLAIVAPGLARSLDELREAIEIVLVDAQAAELRGELGCGSGGGR